MSLRRPLCWAYQSSRPLNWFVGCLSGWLSGRPPAHLPTWLPTWLTCSLAGGKWPPPPLSSSSVRLAAHLAVASHLISAGHKFTASDEPLNCRSSGHQLFEFNQAI